ncbi:unnamed protein product [Notodromas monacha]|uniref:Uncharacterized protein n=1 Tax=Notodromas monacha TaxID=399045 RepID=A0A7R9BP07_9CRUS|nr:unnamed protein product [Notodromas monacha]CAG0918723.1 unnamed protein product [Notodromas monacha]
MTEWDSSLRIGEDISLLPSRHEGSSNYLVPLPPTPRPNHAVLENVSAQSKTYRSEVLEFMVNQSCANFPDMPDFCEEISGSDLLQSVNSAEFGFGSSSKAFMDPIDDAKSVSKVGVVWNNSSCLAGSEMNSDMDGVFVPRSGPLGTLQGDFPKDEPLPFTDYVKRRADSIPLSECKFQHCCVKLFVAIMKTFAHIGSGIPLVPSSVSAACRSTFSAEQRPEVDTGNGQLLTTNARICKTNVPNYAVNATTPVRSMMQTSSVVSESCTTIDLPDRYFDDVGGESCESQKPANSTPMHHPESSFNDPDFSAISMFHNRDDTLELLKGMDLFAKKCNPVVEPVPAKAKPADPPAGVLDSMKNAYPVRTSNSSDVSNRTNGSSGSCESGVAYYHVERRNPRTSFAVFVPEKFDVEKRCCVGVSCPVAIPVQNMSPEFFICSPHVTELTVNGHVVDDPSKILSFTMCTYDIGPNAQTLILCHIVGDALGCIRAKLEFEFEKPNPIEFPGSTKGPTQVSAIKMVLLNAAVELPSVDVRCDDKEFTSAVNQHINLGFFPQRCRLSKSFRVFNLSSSEYSVTIRIAGEDYWTKMFQLVPENRSLIGANNYNSSLVTRLETEGRFDFNVIFKSPALPAHRNSPSNVAVDLIVEMKEPKFAYRLSTTKIICMIGKARPTTNLVDNTLQVPMRSSRSFSISNDGNIPLSLSLEVFPSEPVDSNGRPDSQCSKRSTGSQSSVSNKPSNPCFSVVPKILLLAPKEGQSATVTFDPPPSYECSSRLALQSILQMSVIPNGECFNVNLEGFVDPSSDVLNFQSGLSSPNSTLTSGSNVVRAQGGRDIPVENTNGVQKTASDFGKEKNNGFMKLAIVNKQLYCDPSKLPTSTDDVRQEVKIFSVDSVFFNGVSTSFGDPSNIATVKMCNKSKKDNIVVECSLPPGTCDFFFVSESRKECTKANQRVSIAPGGVAQLWIYCAIKNPSDVPWFQGELKLRPRCLDLKGKARKFTINLLACPSVKPLEVVDMNNERVDAVALRRNMDGLLGGSFLLRNPNESVHCFVFIKTDSWSNGKGGIRIKPDCYLLSPKEIKAFSVAAACGGSAGLSNFGKFMFFCGPESLRRAALSAGCRVERGEINLTQPKLFDHWSSIDGSTHSMRHLQDKDAISRALMMCTQETAIDVVVPDELNGSIDGGRTLIATDASTFFESAETVAGGDIESFMNITEVPKARQPREVKTWDVHPTLLRFDTGQTMVKMLEIWNWTTGNLTADIKFSSEEGLLVYPKTTFIPASSSAKISVDVRRLSAKRRQNSWQVEIQAGGERRFVSVMVSPFLIASGSSTRDSSFSVNKVDGGVGGAPELAGATLALSANACVFGECEMGTSSERVITMRNESHAVKVFWKLERPEDYGKSMDHLVFSSTSRSGVLGPLQTACIAFSFEPLSAVSYSSAWTLCSRIGNEDAKRVEIRLTGRGKDVRQPEKQTDLLESKETMYTMESLGLAEHSVSMQVSDVSDLSMSMGSVKAARHVFIFRHCSFLSSVVIMCNWLSYSYESSTLLMVDMNVIRFPDVEFGISELPLVTKIRLTNNSRTSYKMEYNKLPEPFSTSEAPAVMKPRSYFSVNVRFSPSKRGFFQAEWIAKPVDHPEIAPIKMERQNLIRSEDLKYWNERYEKATRPSDFILKYSDLKPIVEHLIAKTDRILILGCGNSELSECMFRDGYKRITNVDFSPVVIEAMAKKNEVTAQMEWLVMDMLSMTFPDESFDFVLEKATMDSFRGEDSFRSYPGETLISVMRKISKILSPFGKFVMASSQPPSSARGPLERDEFGWSIDYSIVHNTYNVYDNFVYVMRKGETLKTRTPRPICIGKLFDEGDSDEESEEVYEPCGPMHYFW